MAKQDFSLEDILNEVRQRDAQKAYQEAKKFDTQMLLDEILGSTSAPSETASAPKAEEAPPKPTEKEEAPQPAQTKETTPPAEPSEPPKAQREPSPVPSETMPAERPPIPAKRRQPAPEHSRFQVDAQALRRQQEETESRPSPLWGTAEINARKLAAQWRKAAESAASVKPEEETAPVREEADEPLAEEPTLERIAPEPAVDEKTQQAKIEEFDELRRRRADKVKGFTLVTPPNLEEGQQLPADTPAQPARGMSPERAAALQEKLKHFHTDAFAAAEPTAEAPTRSVPLPKADESKTPEAPREETPSAPEADEGDFEEYTAPEQAEVFAAAFRKTYRRGVLKLVGLAVLFVLSLGAAVIAGTEGSPLWETSPLLLCVTQLVLAVLGLAFSMDRVKDGFQGLRPGRSSRDTLLCLAAVMVIVFGVVLAVVDPSAYRNAGISLYVPVVLFNLLAGSAGKLLEYRTVRTNFKVVSAPAKYDKYALLLEKDSALSEDLARPGQLEERAQMAFSRKTDFLDGFVRRSADTGYSDKIGRVSTPVFLILSLLAGVLAFFVNDLFMAFTVFTGSLALSAGAVSVFLTAFPLYTTARTLSRLGGAVLGGQGAQEYENVNALLLDAADLFYPKNVTLYGIKTFSDNPIDHVILDATSVLCRTRSVLGCVFLKIISGRTDYLSKVDSISYEEGLGISAWVNDRRILIGSRELMIHHGISVPSKDYEDRYLEQSRDLIYLAASGELAGVFILGLSYSEDIRNMLIDLYNHSVLAIVRTVDPVFTQEKLAQIFDLPPETFAVVPNRFSKEVDQELEPSGRANTSVCHNGKLASQIYSLLCAKQLSRPVSAGRWIYLISAGLGVALFVVFTLLGGVGQLSNLFLCFYELVCLLLCLFVQYAGRLK